MPENPDPNNNQQCSNGNRSTEDDRNSGNRTSGEQGSSNLVPGGQYDELAFDLEWSIKKQLVNHLNDFSEFMLVCDDQDGSDELKKRLIKQNSGLLALLAALPCKSKKRKNGEPVEESTDEAKLIATLSWASRDRIVRHLFNQVSYGLLDDLVISKLVKLSVIKQNNEVIMLLLNLPVAVKYHRPTAADCDAIESNAKKQRVDNQKFQSEIKDQVAELKNEISDLKTEISDMNIKLSERINQVDIDRGEVTFEYELTEVLQFFQSIKGNKFSESFHCRSLTFFLGVDFQRKLGQPNYMGFYLFCSHNDSLKWSCSARFTLKVISQLPDVPDRVEKFQNEFQMSSGIGNSQFISVEELLNQKNGLIKDNKIKLSVHLKADKLIRTLSPTFAF